MNPYQKLRAWLLKRKVRKLLRDLYAVYDSYSCGSFLTEYISTEVRELKDNINKILDKLAKIDPTCPTRRF